MLDYHVMLAHSRMLVRVGLSCPDVAVGDVTPCWIVSFVVEVGDVTLCRIVTSYCRSWGCNSEFDYCRRFEVRLRARLNSIRGSRNNSQ